jgi:hypothetical protein
LLLSLFDLKKRNGRYLSKKKKKILPLTIKKLKTGKQTTRKPYSSTTAVPVLYGENHMGGKEFHRNLVNLAEVEKYRNCMYSRDQEYMHYQYPVNPGYPVQV